MASRATALARRPALAAPALACAASALAELGGAALGGDGPGGSSGAKTAAAVAQAAALAGATAVLSAVAVRLDMEPLLQQRRRNKPVPKTVLAGGGAVVLAGLAAGVAVLLLQGRGGAGQAVAGGFAVLSAWLGMLAALWAGAVILTLWVVELELSKPPDAPMDSVLLYHLRCLCWSEESRRAILVCGPLALTAVLGAILTAAHWNDAEGGAACRDERRTYLSVATALLGTYAVMVSALVRCSYLGRRGALAIIICIILSSLAWGCAGTISMSTSDCTTAAEPAAMHMLLVIFGITTLVFTLLCNTEAALAPLPSRHFDMLSHAAPAAVTRYVDRLERISEVGSAFNEEDSNEQDDSDENDSNGSNDSAALISR
ncbi:Hypothetical Protein FCC1311_038462 [Hondaea fermentalgiana]|uniref:Uncharacterized protein n=1 Tax=Hondaea fermentalgiana TaxID=2315210 RepID=A0A2R5GG48_9STRA|nr:Hypothetical Protein FCC1311_038462 [Hondaea fermentalgiana]|eukprot:GBG27623.1 Hypothetical Protein FCC1311_038462 [Hondaea fermentalgiana]